MERNKDAIVHIASIAAHRPSLMTGPAYAAAKSAMIGLPRHMARDFGPLQIRVNLVAPGFVMSGQRIQILFQSLPNEIRVKMLSEMPLGRPAKPKEIAEVVLFFSSESSSFVTGVVLDVDGGSYMG